MRSFRLSGPSPAMVVACVALSFALAGSAVAGTDALNRAVTKSKVKKIAKKQAKKQLRKNVSGSHVNTADNATNATNANNANNSTNLGGKPLGDVRSTSGAAQNAAVVNIGGGTDVVTGQITTTGPSQVLVAGTVELEGASADERAQCTLRLDGNLISLGYETTFDDVGANNEASLTVLGSANNVAAGAHTATLNCAALNGTVIKDDAAINMTGIPNP